MSPSTQNQNYDVIVVGGGVVGVSLAYHLVCEGAKTLLIDRQDVGRATAAGAGILSPPVSNNRSEIWFDLAIRAFDYYPALIDQLRADQDGETSYAVCGQLTVAVAEAELPEFSRTEEIVFERQRQRGTPSPDDLRLVTPDVAKTLLPPLAYVKRAIYYRHAARVNGRLLAQALQQAAEHRGLTMKQANVERLALDGYLVDGVIVEGNLIRGGMVAIAGGAWSNQFAAQLLLDIPVQPQRGQIIHFQVHDTETRDWPILKSRQGYYLVCWPGGRIVMGATREMDSGYAPYPTAAGIRKVLEELTWALPGLKQAELKEIRVGLRPKSKDSLPLLGQVPGVDNLYIATGHGSTGLQIGPYSAKLVADKMMNRQVAMDLTPFDVRRFM